MFNPALTDAQKAERIEALGEALERNLAMMEEFENESIQFLGQDDYFTEEVSNIRRTGRFISSGEVRLLVESFLKKIDTSTSLKPVKSGRHGNFVLRPDDTFMRFVRHYADGVPGQGEFVRALEYRTGGVPLTFDSEIACQDHSLAFVTIHHPLVKAIARYVRETNLEMGSLACLTLTDFPAAVGDYLFFVYLLEESSLKRSLKLVPVLVNLADKEVVHVVDEAAAQFIGRLPTAEPCDAGSSFGDADVNDCLARANEYMAMLRDDEERILVQRNNALIDARIDTKRRAYQNKIQAVRSTLAKVETSGGPETIARLHRGRIRKFEEKLRKDVEDLEARRGVHVGFSLIAGGLVSVRP